MKYLLSDQQRIRFLQAAFKRLGCYYVWPDQSNGYSGKDLSGAKYQNVYDCSGFITSSLYQATGIDHRATWNAMRLMKNCQRIEDPQPGDLCFYGSSRNKVTHVMLYIGNSKKRPQSIPNNYTCMGASGGWSQTLTPQIAKAKDAKVKAYKSHMYRSDFLGFGRLATNDG